MPQALDVLSFEARLSLAPQDEDASCRRIASHFRMRTRVREELLRVHSSKMTPHAEVPAQRASKDEEWGK